MTFKDHFSGLAAAYADCRPSYPPAVAQALAALSPGRALALDCGCGNGQLSVLLGDVFDRVEATDASAAQIAHAVPHPRVAYRVAPAEESGLPDGCCDLVVAAQAAHWFDLPRYFAEVRRVLRPGGLAALVGYGRLVVGDPAAAAVVDRFYGPDGVGRYWPPERPLVEDGYAAVAFPFAEIPGPDIAMSADWTRDQLLGYVTTWSALKEARKALAEDPFPAFAEALAAAWPDGDATRTIRWPLRMRLGRP
jgi:SAM-dependent methyltransferase